MYVSIKRQPGCIEETRIIWKRWAYFFEPQSLGCRKERSVGRQNGIMPGERRIQMPLSFSGHTQLQWETNSWKTDSTMEENRHMNKSELKELWKTMEKPETKKLWLLQISEIGSFIEIKSSLPKGRIWKQCHTQGECSRVFWSFRHFYKENFDRLLMS